MVFLAFVPYGGTCGHVFASRHAIDFLEDRFKMRPDIMMVDLKINEFDEMEIRTLKKRKAILPFVSRSTNSTLE